MHPRRPHLIHPIPRLLAVGLTTLLLLTMLPTGASAQTRTLRLASTAWPPFTNVPDEPRFAADLVDEALSRLDISTETTIVTPAEFTAALLDGRFDGSPAVWRDEAREAVLLYSDAYLQNRLVLVGRRNADVSATSLAALTGRRVAIIEGYAYGDAIVEAGGPAFVRSADAAASLAMLLRGEVDYMLVDELVVEYLLRDHAEAAVSRLTISTVPLVTRSLHLAIRRDLPDAESIISRFNAQLNRMVADRTYHRLLHLDWIRADIDDDGLAEFIPESDQTGPAPPERGYSLFRTAEAAIETGARGRFFIGGTIYTGWADVPDMYKVKGEDRPDPNRAVIPLIGFSW